MNLPVRLRTVIYLYYVEGYQVKEIADILKIKESAVKKRMQRGRGGHHLITSDAYAIAAVSEHREGAWKFIEGFLAQEKSEDYYRSPHNNFDASFPALKKTLNEKVENSIEEGSQIPGDQFPTRIYSDGATFQYHVLTWDEVNVILDLIPDATPFFSVEEDEIIKIINEEAYGYYSGQKRVEDVIGIIQNRVQLYVNENI